MRVRPLLLEMLTMSERFGRRERGVAMVVTALAMLALLGGAALSIDVGLVMATRSQLQSVADSSARAALVSLRQNGTSSFAITEAVTMAGNHEAGGESFSLDPLDVTVGNYDFAANTFSPGLGFGAPAVQVTARRAAGAAKGPINLFFAPVVGLATADVSASAVATIRRRDLVLVQDRTVSFIAEFPFAQDADRDLVDAMEAQGLSGDRMGLVSFARDSIDEANLTPLSGGNPASLKSTIDNFPLCTSAGPPGGPCYGTDLAMGLNAATNMLQNQSTAGDAERVIVLVSDGVPCIAELGGWTAVNVGKTWATAAANAAGNAGINIFTVTLDQGPGGSPCTNADVTFNESLVRGFGRGFTTTNPSDLDDLLTAIISQMPIYLVQ